MIKFKPRCNKLKLVKVEISTSISNKICEIGFSLKYFTMTKPFTFFKKKKSIITGNVFMKESPFFNLMKYKSINKY